MRIVKEIKISTCLTEKPILLTFLQAPTYKETQNVEAIRDLAEIKLDHWEEVR